MNKKALTALAGALALLATAGCSAGTSSNDGGQQPPPGSHASPAAATSPAAPLPTATSNDPYVSAIGMFHQLGLKVWADSDLVGRWQEGPKSFHEALVRDAQLAKLPGVVGIKVADELGYNDGLDTPQQVQRFLDDTARGLHALAPGTKVLVDMVVPDLGCLPWLASQLPQASSCAADQRAKYPAATMSAVTGYLASGDIDELDLSTGLRDPSEYASWGVGVDEAQRDAWAEVNRLGWQHQVTLQSRHALAHPGSFTEGAATAWSDVNTYVRIPTQAGAASVQVWSWRQTYGGQVVRLMDPGLQSNSLWQALLAARRDGAVLTTTFTPSSVEKNVAEDARTLAEVFQGVYVAAGTG